MEHASANTFVDVGTNIGALEFDGLPVAIGMPGDIELESSVFMGPPPTKSLQCPTFVCNITKPAGCHF
jgi:hypothetical protein